MNLQHKNCVQVDDNAKPLTADQIEVLLPQVYDWEVIEVDGIRRLQRTIPMEDFNDALLFANHVGDIAERQEHHPRLIVEWGQVTVEWWTHDIGGLHQNDFIMAAKTNDISRRWPELTGNKDIVQMTSEESFPASDPPPW
jgi:4a-hydroxytetrahydrobiopterin dehydratase